MAAEHKSNPLEHAIDLFIHLPVGFLLELPHSVPRCIERGKQEVEQLSHQASSTLRALGLRPEGPDDDAVEPSRPSAASTSPAEPADVPASPVAPVTAHQEQAPAPAPAPGIDPELLPIPGYDSLSASQVIPRLDDLDTDELELVRSYEASARGRKTILSRVAQLQGS